MDAELLDLLGALEAGKVTVQDVDEWVTETAWGRETPLVRRVERILAESQAAGTPDSRVLERLAEVRTQAILHHTSFGVQIVVHQCAAGPATVRRGLGPSQGSLGSSIGGGPLEIHEHLTPA